MINLFDKLFTFIGKWILHIMGVFVFSLLVLLMYMSVQNERKEDTMYMVQYNKEEIWTEQVTYNPDGSIQFINYENKRPYKVYGGNYVIIEPKIK